MRCVVLQTTNKSLSLTVSSHTPPFCSHTSHSPHIRAPHPHLPSDMSGYRTDSYNPLIDDPGFEMDIIAAASMGDYRKVQRLLLDGADAGPVNSSGWTPLMYAAHYGHISVVRVLVEAGCDVNQKEWSDQRSALMLAASNGHTKCLDLLINTGGADITATDSSGKTAAHYAAAHGHAGNQIIRELLQIATPAASSPVPPVLVTQTTPRTGPADQWQRAYNTTDRCATAGSSVRSETPSPFLAVGSRAHGEPSSPKKHRPSPSTSRERDADCRKRIDFGLQLRSSEKRKFLPSTLSELLDRLGLGEHLPVFASHDIDLFTFPDLSDEDLIELGITKLGHRKKMAAAQQRLIESVEIRSAQEAIFADYLLHERTRLQHENDKLKTFIVQWRDSVNLALQFVSRLFAEDAGTAAPDSSTPVFRSL